MLLKDSSGSRAVNAGTMFIIILWCFIFISEQKSRYLMAFFLSFENHLSSHISAQVFSPLLEMSSKVIAVRAFSAACLFHKISMHNFTVKRGKPRNNLQTFSLFTFFVIPSNVIRIILAFKLNISV